MLRRSGTADPTQLVEALPERGEAVLSLWVDFAKGKEHTDPPHPLALLCTRRKRPRSRAAKD